MAKGTLSKVKTPMIIYKKKKITTCIRNRRLLSLYIEPLKLKRKKQYYIEKQPKEMDGSQKKKQKLL